MRIAVTNLTAFLITLAPTRGDVSAPAPIRSEVVRVGVHHNQVWATYNYPQRRPDGITGWNEQITSDTVPKIKLLDSVLSPSHDRYFYVSVVPGFEGLHRAMYPNYDESSGETRERFTAWQKNDTVMHLCVHRLSGDLVTRIDLPASYWGEYQRGGWLDDHWISLHHRHGKTGGNFFTLFINVDTQEKRLIGLEIEDEKAGGDRRFVTFTHRNLFFVNFRPVYPISDEPLPDFGEEAGWKAYREKYFVRKEARPWQRTLDHRVSRYELTPDGKKAILLDHRDWSVWKPNENVPPEEDRPKVPLEQIPAPELVVIDLDKIEKTKDPKQYSTKIDLPKDNRAQLIREDKAKEFRVYAADGRTILWRKSFAELAADAP